MVHCGTSISYLTSIDAAKDRDIEQGSRNCNEAGGFPCWRNYYRHEPNIGAAGEPDASLAGYQEGEI